MTNKQERAIEYHLWQRPESATEWVEWKEWLSQRVKIDEQTAKQIIIAFDKDNYEIAIKLIKNL